MSRSVGASRNGLYDNGRPRDMLASIPRAAPDATPRLTRRRFCSENSLSATFRPREDPPQWIDDRRPTVHPARGCHVVPDASTVQQRNDAVHFGNGSNGTGVQVGGGGGGLTDNASGTGAGSGGGAEGGDGSIGGVAIGDDAGAFGGGSGGSASQGGAGASGGGGGAAGAGTGRNGGMFGGGGGSVGAGNGGFGGGGGSVTGDGGDGGFGAGGGTGSTEGAGGFGGGFGGGGGAAFGGAIFVRSGGTLIVRGSGTIGIGTVTGGAGLSAAKDGSAAGDAVFLEDTTVIFEPGTGETQSVLGSIADDFGNAASAGGSVIKIGAGTTILAGANIYAGTTAVTAGKLVIDGSNASSTLTSVQSGATLGGSGTVGTTTVNFGGILAPGSSVGILRFANASISRPAPSMR